MSDWLSPNPPHITIPLVVIRLKKNSFNRSSKTKYVKTVINKKTWNLKTNHDQQG